MTEQATDQAREINVVIGGEAGQGLVTIGRLLGRALVRAGQEIMITQSYHSRVRGGHNTFAVRAGNVPSYAPRDTIDLLVALNGETVTLHRDQLTPGGLIIADTAFAGGASATVAVPFIELGPEKMWNTVAFGLAGNILGLAADLLLEAIEAVLGAKDSGSLAENQKALTRSYQWAAERIMAPHLALAAGAASGERLLLNGSEAIALGALAGGLKFCAFYPMTPATGIAVCLIENADTMGCVIEQAEDEIAAINMAIGASFAGAPAMVATSGGGFALMTEGVSLAGMTETPVLVVVGQRPGPATGLPTRTEQADLEFVLHGGHGEFPRAIFAPGELESCWTLTQRALATAERYQTPVFLLTDQFLADSSRAIPPFDPELIEPVKSGADPEAATTPYRRYALTADGISPRLLPGYSEHLVVADSDEHYENGHITEEQPVRVAMVDKRLRKLTGMAAEVLPPQYDGGPAPELLLVCWGSSRGPVAEAANLLAGQGKKVATLHFTQLWPLRPEQFLGLLQAAGRVVCIEGNATGQFARLLKRESGFAILHRVLRYDGLPFTAQYIIDRLNGAPAPAGSP